MVGVALRWVTIETNRQPSVCASASETSGNQYKINDCI